MKRRVETEQLELGPIDFLIDLVQEEQDSFYVEIFQHKLQPKETHKTLKFDTAILADVIRILQNYQAIIEGGKYEVDTGKRAERREIHVAEKEQDRIQTYYLKGVSIADIAQQLGRSSELIERVLRHREII